MTGNLILHSIGVQNLLSFGEAGIDLDLQPLNVLIGPNASGKSNFIEVLRLLSYAPTDLTLPILGGGGVSTSSAPMQITSRWC